MAPTPRLALFLTVCGLGTLAATAAQAQTCRPSCPAAGAPPVLVDDAELSFQLTITMENYGAWTYDRETGLYTRQCFLPGGGHQLLVFWQGRPEWILWYNPAKRVYWCACPTTSHPLFGRRIAQGESLFLRCQVKSRRLSQIVLEDESQIAGAMTTQNVNGDVVDIAEVPSDKPLL